MTFLSTVENVTLKNHFVFLFGKKDNNKLPEKWKFPSKFIEKIKSLQLFGDNKIFEKISGKKLTYQGFKLAYSVDWSDVSRCSESIWIMIKKSIWRAHRDLDYIIRAEKCEKDGHILESQKLFEEGITKMRNSLKECMNASNKDFYRMKIREFQEKSSLFRKIIETQMNNSLLVEQIVIPANVRGHSFQKLFDKYLNDNIFEVHIYEPLLENEAHFKDLVHFLEVIVKSCPNLQYVRTITKRDLHLTSQQMRVFQSLKNDLTAGNISFSHQFDNSIDEARIIFNDGIIIKSSHGLHIYQPSSSSCSLGMCDYDFCHCHESQIKIFRSTPFKAAAADQRAFVEPTEFRLVDEE